jgi:hypothetical protein
MGIAGLIWLVWWVSSFFVGEMTVMLLTTEKKSRWRLPSRQMQTGHWSVMQVVGQSVK